jgi:hypothetical protein
LDFIFVVLCVLGTYNTSRYSASTSLHESPVPCTIKSLKESTALSARVVSILPS